MLINVKATDDFRRLVKRITTIELDDQSQRLVVEIYDELPGEDFAAANITGGDRDMLRPGDPVYVVTGVNPTSEAVCLRSDEPPRETLLHAEDN